MMKAIRMVGLVAVLAGLCYVLLPVPLPFSGDRGEYNPITGLMWCSDQWSCLHELGHKLDHQSGWISQGEDFRNALKFYVVVEIESRHPSALAQFILDYPFSDGAHSRPGYNLQAELYADIFAGYAKGNPTRLPPVIAQFYDKARAQKLVTQYLGGTP